MSKKNNPEPSQQSRLFFYCACFTVFALVCRLGELVPILGQIRINFLSLGAATLLFFLSGVVGSRKWLGEKEVKLMLSLTLLALVTIPFSVWPGRSFEYFVKGPMLINLAIFAFILSVTDNTKDLKTIVKVFMFSLVVLAIMLFINPVLDSEGRYTVSYSLDPNDLSLLFVSGFPIVLAFFLMSKGVNKLIPALIMAMLVLGVFKTGSRGGYVAFVCVAGLIFFSRSIRLSAMKKLAFALLVCVLVFSSQADNIRDRLKHIVEGTDYNLSQEEGSGGRLALWKDGTRLLVRDHLLIGAGSGNTRVAMGTEYGDYRWRAVHNSYLQIALELGVLGLILYLFIIYTAIKNYTKAINYFRDKPKFVELSHLAACLKISVIAYLIAASFLSQSHSVVVPFFLATSAGLKKIAERLQEDEKAGEHTVNGGDKRNVMEGSIHVR